MKTIIVGGGLSGLMLGQKIASYREIAVFDKGRGVGGRLATRRTDRARFDHGAQFYRLKEPVRELHQRWLARGLVKFWFSEGGQDHFNAIDGMTALAKDLAHDCNVTLNERVLSINKNQKRKWMVSFESGRSDVADAVVLSCPVPQSLDIFKSSGITYSSRLAEVTYAKLLVILFENFPVPFHAGTHGYLEPKNSLIFSIADQHAKGISQIPALAVTLNTETSEAMFEAPEDEVIQKTIRELRRLSPSFASGPAQVKKWRYGQVVNAYGEFFSQVQEGLFLVGDGFGGASLNGAARSAAALGEYLRDVAK